MNEPKTEYEVTIIGGGPAGIAAAIWCSRIGLEAVLFEKQKEFGGQLLAIHNPIEDYPGVCAATGSELRDKFLKSTEAINVPLLSDSEIVKADLAEKTVHLADGRIVRSKTVMIATGVRRRRLGIPGEMEFEGRGILRSGVEAKAAVRGKKVVIVGGGDAAVENALILSDAGADVVLVHRRSDLTARKEFVDKLLRSSKIKVVTDTTLAAIKGEEKVAAVDVRNIQDEATRVIETDAVLIRIGVVPNTELFVDQGILNDNGYIRTGSDCSTNVPLVYGLGDAAYPISPTICTAVGSAATAVKAVHSLIKASPHV